jgi:hypothetical protein
MNNEITTADKKDWKCLKMADGSVYYGQMVDTMAEFTD